MKNGSEVKKNDRFFFSIMMVSFQEITWFRATSLVVNHANEPRISGMDYQKS
jgi:hypothetical protein